MPSSSNLAVVLYSYLMQARWSLCVADLGRATRAFHLSIWKSDAWAAAAAASAAAWSSNAATFVVSLCSRPCERVSARTLRCSHGAASAGRSRYRSSLPTRAPSVPVRVSRAGARDAQQTVRSGRRDAGRGGRGKRRTAQGVPGQLGCLQQTNRALCVAHGVVPSFHQHACLRQQPQRRHGRQWDLQGLRSV